MMRQRGAGAQHHHATYTTVEEVATTSQTRSRQFSGETSTTSSAADNQPNPPLHRQQQQQEGRAEEHYDEEEGRFVGLDKSKRSWSSQELTSVAAASAPPQTYHQSAETFPSAAAAVDVPPKMGLHNRISPPRSGGLLIESSSSSALRGQPKPAKPPSTAPSLQDFHVVYRTAHHVPDNRYKYHLQGRRVANKQQMLSKVCCAQVGLAFSTVAFVFLIWVGFMLDMQPLYMKGVLPQHIMMPGTDDDQWAQLADNKNGNNNNNAQQQHRVVKPVALYKLPGDGERLTAATSAYRAALAYLACGLYCCHILYPNWICSKLYRLRNQYERIDDHHEKGSEHFEVAEKGRNGGGLPLYANGDSRPHETSTSPSTAYFHARNVWNQMAVMTRQWLAARGWYQPGKRRRRKKVHGEKRQRKTKKTG